MSSEILEVLNELGVDVKDKLRLNTLIGLDLIAKSICLKRSDHDNIVRFLLVFYIDRIAMRNEDRDYIKELLSGGEEMQKEDIAKVCHEANKSYCETIGDSTQLPWMSAHDWQKESAIDGVQNIIENPNSTPEDSHNRWLEVKKKDGWVNGEKKDLNKKTHPCMVSYSELPLEQKIKDQLFLAVAKTLLQRTKI